MVLVAPWLWLARLSSGTFSLLFSDDVTHDDGSSRMNSESTEKRNITNEVNLHYADG